MARGRSKAGTPTPRIANRLQGARERRFVGRPVEQALWREALVAKRPDFAVLWIVGPGGVGKTALLARFASIARAEGVQPVAVDARRMVGSPESFLAELARALELPGPTDVVAALGQPGRRALLIDSAEQLGGVETWLRETFIPSLPDSCPVAIAGRAAPQPSWRADAGWAELLRVISLRNLSPEESRALLHARGVDPSQHEALLMTTHGHPLALSLVADVLRHSPGLSPALASRAPDVLAVLLERFAHDAADEVHRAALYAAAHVRAIDESLLRRAVDPRRASELYDWLADLSFSELGVDGLYLHDLAAQALDSELRRRDPERYAEMHRRLREPCVRLVADSTGAAQYAAATDLAWMHRFSPVMGGMIDWASARSLYPSALQESDRRPAVEAARRFEGDAAAALVEYWLDRQPSAFTMVRGGPGRTMGFICCLTISAEDEEAGRDPRVRAALEEVARSAPLRAGERIAVVNWIDFESYMDPGAFVYQVSVHGIRSWFTRSRPAWSFQVVGERLDLWAPLMTYIQHRPGPRVRVGDHLFSLFCHDWRAMPPELLLDVMAEREIRGVGDGSVLAPPPASELLVLSHESFAAAVRDALRAYSRSDALAENPLMRCRLVASAEGDGEPLRAMLSAAVEQLAHAGKDEKMFAALKVTYLDPARTQEEAAELLGMPFSTYRRHLAAGVDRVIDWLWQRELHG
jgi:hypothetical protein